MGVPGQASLIGISLSLACLFVVVAAGSGCQSDYSDWILQPYCAETCKKIGIKGDNKNYEGATQFPSGVFGIYSRFGNANARSKYTKAGGWMISYGCVGDAKGGEVDSWHVSNTGSSSGAVIYSPYKVTCPSDTRNWWARGEAGAEWSTTGRKANSLGDWVQVVCNPTNEADFAPPADSTNTGGDTSGAFNKELQPVTLAMVAGVLAWA